MYHGIYSAVGFGTSTHSFVTVAYEKNAFPPQVMYENKAYRLVRTFLVSTPKQHESFVKYCVTQGCELDVEIT